MEFTTTPEATMNTLEAKIEATLTNLDIASVYLFTHTIAPAAESFVKGVFYAGGPAVIAAYDADGAYLGYVKADLLPADGAEFAL